MNIGTQILKIRTEKGLTQDEFGKIFHVTRQTVSNWENEKSYPDLQILIDISNRFDISLDVLIKEDVKMVKTMDKERVLGSLKREKSVIDFFTGAGTGIVITCLLSADTMVRTVTIVLGVVMIGLPGEVVEIKDGKVYIDGSPTPLDDSFIPEKMIGSYGPYTVPENCYFMLGDNRNDSKDSRSWKNKFVRFDQLVGKAVVRYYPSFKWLG